MKIASVADVKARLSCLFERNASPGRWSLCATVRAVAVLLIDQRRGRIGTTDPGPFTQVPGIARSSLQIEESGGIRT